MSIPNRIAILNSDGTTDTSFAVGYGLDAAGYCVQVTPEDLVKVGGAFSQVDLSMRDNFAVINLDGTVESATADTDGAVHTLLPQTDGKLILGGAFTTVGGTSRSRLARLNSDLTLEEAYAPSFNGTVKALAQQETGETLVGGSFSTVSGTSRANVARLYNTDAPTNLTVENVDLVQWLRSGASQEVQRVSFEKPAGTPIAGTITRITGGWQFVPSASLTGSGTITARAYPTDSHSEGILEDTVSYNVDPEIQVSVNGVILEDAVSTVDYDQGQVGSITSRVFQISNIGLDTLNFTNGPNHVALSGANANQWSIVAQPPGSLEPGDSANVQVNFVPTSEGNKTATLTIHSNDADEGTFTVSLEGEAIPGPGGQDATWQPVVNNAVYSTTIGRNENIWLGGFFTSVNSLSRNRIAYLNQSGVVQTQTGTGVTGGTSPLVYGVCQLPNGKLLIGGAFTTVNGVARARLARLNSDGSLDTSFNVTTPNTVNGFILEPSGNVIILSLYTINGVSTGCARLLTATDTLDTSFIVNRFNLSGGYAQTDGKIVLYAAASSFPATSLFRVNTDGSIDSTLSPTFSTSGGISCATPTRTGEIVFGGYYLTLNGVPRNGVNRMTNLGVYDSGFTQIDTYPSSMQMQCDGKVLIGATSYLSLAATERLTRALSTGANDTTFAATARNTVHALCLQEDGKVLVGGLFTLSGSATKGASRLINDANGASSALSVVSPTQVQWLRGGTSPEVQIVRFAFSQDSGVTWTDLGQGTRVTNGWELSGIALPSNGILRGQAYLQCGLYNASVTIHEDQVIFSNLAVGDLNVEFPVGTTIADDGSTTFSDTLPGQFSDRVFTLRNTGLGTITSISITVPTSDWTLVSAPSASLDANQTTTFTLRFSPSAVGVRGPVFMRVNSSVPGAKNPYTIALNGNGVAVPLATTVNSTSPGTGQRTLNGTFRANASTASAYFQYKLAASTTWIDTTSPAAISGFTNVSVSKTITGLTVGQTYNWRAICYNAVNVGQAPASPFVGVTGTFVAT